MGTLRQLTVNNPSRAGEVYALADVPLTPEYATRARNKVTNRAGALVSRKTLTAYNTGTPFAELAGVPKNAYYWVRKDGLNSVVAPSPQVAVDGKWYLTLGEDSSAFVTRKAQLLGTVTDSAWSFCVMNDKLCMAQRGHTYQTTTEYSSGGRVGLVTMNSHAGTQQWHYITSAFNRVWGCDTPTNKYTVWWSDTLDPTNFSSGTAGNVNLLSVFTNGPDEVVCVTGFNNYLVIFCKNTIVIYDGAAAPGSMVLVEVLNNIGILNKNAFVHVGDELWFMNRTGVYSLSRVIQEKSLPKDTRLPQLGLNEINTLAELDEIDLQLMHDSTHKLVIINNKQDKLAYVVNLTARRGEEVLTSWGGTDLVNNHFFYKSDLAELCSIGDNGFYYKYDGYGSTTLPVSCEVHTPWMQIADDNLTIPKTVKFWLTAPIGTSVTVRIRYDYNDANEEVRTVTLPGTAPAEYGIAEYGIAEYSYVASVNTNKVAGARRGRLIKLIFEYDATGYPVTFNRWELLYNTGAF